MYTESQTDRVELLIRNHAPLVKKIAHHLSARLPSSIQIDDLIQAGMIGLLEASRKYDPSLGASFETYAGIRIRGSMMDEVRKGDWVPRSVHRNSRRIAEAFKLLSDRLGRDAEDHEVAHELEISLEDYYSQLQDSNCAKLFSYEELEEDAGEVHVSLSNGSGNPQSLVQDDQFKLRLVEEIAKLPERERLVLSLYYDQELNLKEIGEVLSVSESRVSQIHSQAALRLKSRLSDWHGN
jgi:RNA polymerase sigma factor for flagellar operon FliA